MYIYSRRLLLYFLFGTNVSIAQHQVLLRDSVLNEEGGSPINLIKIGKTLFYMGLKDVNGPFGFYPYKTDGAFMSTRLLKNVSTGIFRDQTEGFVAKNDTLFFSAKDFTMGLGSELWKSDGTAEGTVLVKDINPGPYGSNVRNLINIDNTLYFTANDTLSRYKLWKSDGTASGTIAIKSLPGEGISVQLRAFKSQLYIFFYSESSRFVQLWKSNGTAAGTVLLHSFKEGDITMKNPILATEDYIYFLGSDWPHAGLLWQSDGTVGGTKVALSDSDGSFSFLNLGYIFKNRLVFNGTRQTSLHAPVSRGLWIYDGVQAIKLYDESLPSIESLDAVERNGVLYFTVTNSIIYRTDGTPAGTYSIPKTGLYPDRGAVKNLSIVDNSIYFTKLSIKTGFSIWKTDGSDETTSLVTQVLPSEYANFVFQGSYYWARAIGGQLYYSFQHPTYGAALWRLESCPSTTNCVPIRIAKRN